MFCKYCGKQIDDNVVFCPDCGKAVKAVNSENATPAEQYSADNQNNNTVEPSVQNVQGVNFVAPTGVSETPQTTVAENSVQNDYGVNPDFQPQPKKKRKLPKVLAIVGVCVVVIAVIVALNFSFILGTLIKTFGSGSDYMRFVEGKQVSSYAENISEAYGDNLLEALSSDKSQTANLSVKLSDKGRELINTFSTTGEDIDLEWLEDAKVSFTSNRDGETQQFKMGLDLGGKDIISTDYIMDAKNKEVYIAIPELSEKYLMTDIEGMDDFSFNDIDKIVEALPDESKLNDMIETYADIIIDSLDDVALDDSTIEISNIEEDCTKLTLKVSERQVLEICQKILNEAENDEELKDVIRDIVKALNDISGEPAVAGDADEMIDEMKNSVKNALDSLDGDGEDLFTLVDYVNGSHEIIGRAIEVNGEEVISYVTVEDGNDVYYQLKISEECVITGKAEESGDKINGEFTVEVEGQEILLIETKDFDADKLKKGELVGSLSIKPGATLTAVSDPTMPVSVSDVSLEMNFLEESADVKLLMEGEELITLGVDTESKDSSKIDIPKDSDVCDTSDETALSEYFATMDFYTIIDNLSSAGIPEEFIEELETSLFSIGMSAY
ncbi:MAG: zinc-ribbon domain-containing protein [Ruminococcus sp.]